jgi:hypothetical protein
MSDIDQFTAAYIECSLWASTDEDGEPLYCLETELSDETRATMVGECADFQTRFAELLEQSYNHTTIDYNEEYAGHDFWLTRNGHGAGFWDRGLGEIGKRLTEVSKQYGTVDLYIGDDGLIYA